MTCPRCGGLMKSDLVIPSGCFEAIEVECCINCGEIVDELIIHNRRFGVVLHKNRQGRKKVISA